MRHADYLVLAFALLLLPTLYGTLWSPSVAGESVRIVDVNGKESIVPLNVNRRIEVKGPLGLSVIEVHGGAVRFLSSPCQGKLCIHSGWLKNGNDFTACLPNRVSIAVIGGREEYDSVNF